MPVFSARSAIDVFSSHGAYCASLIFYKQADVKSGKIARTLWLSAFLIISASGFAHAQNGGQILRDIFGDVLREIDRQQNQKQQEQIAREIAPHWEACSNGDVDACDRVAQFSLSRKGQRQLQKMRADAVERQAFLAQWTDCFSGGIEQACSFALRYSRLDADDRGRILNKIAEIRQAREEAQRREQEAARREQERSRQEQAFRAQWADCFSGAVIQACNAALKYPQVSEDDRVRILTKVDAIRKAQAVAESRKREEQRRQREEAEALRLRIEAEKLERERIEQDRKLAAVLSECKQKSELSCQYGIDNARDGMEREQFAHYLDVAQSPLGIPLLKPLNGVPWKIVGISAVVVLLLALLAFGEAKYRVIRESGPRLWAKLQSRRPSFSFALPAATGRSADAGAVTDVIFPYDPSVGRAQPERDRGDIAMFGAASAPMLAAQAPTGAEQLRETTIQSPPPLSRTGGAPTLVLALNAKTIAVAVLGLLLCLAAVTVISNESFRLAIFRAVGADPAHNAFVNRCMVVSGATAPDCSCASGVVRETMGPERWRVLGYFLQGDRARAEAEMVKAGIVESFSLMSRSARGFALAEQQCRVRRLREM
jgi:hypothetical protein